MRHTSHTFVSDSQRFQAWMRNAFEAPVGDAETLSLGPLRAVVLGAGDQATGWVTLSGDDFTKRKTLDALAELRATLKQRKATMEFEFDEKVYPHVAEWLESAGLHLMERNPLMACRPETFQPFAAPDVSLTRLNHDARPTELEAFQGIRWTDGGESKRRVPGVDGLRAELRSETSVFLLAWLDWEPVGTGVSHVTGEAAEIVGVVTRVDRRRRGVAATVTSDLVRRHFDRGGDFVFLDAANEAAAKVYERLGFSLFGSKLVYR
jgi:predicted GNAT family acetyltransferase